MLAKGLGRRTVGVCLSGQGYPISTRLLPGLSNGQPGQSLSRLGERIRPRSHLVGLGALKEDGQERKNYLLNSAPRLQAGQQLYAGRIAHRGEMSVQVNTPAGRIIEEQIDEHLRKIEKEFDADALAYFGPIYYGTDESIRDAIESLKTKRSGKTAQKGKRSKLVVILETSGGYAEVAERIANLFHKHYNSVEFVVPNYAMSAGTILVMSGNEIWMDYFSILGPIDPQLEGPKGQPIPAHGYLVQYDRLIKKSKRNQITTAELQFLLEKFDPAELYQYEQEMNLSVTLLKEWLVKYKFRTWNKTDTRRLKVTEKRKRACAQFVAKELNNTKKWHSHSRGISMETLRRDIKLKINDLEDKPALKSCVKAYYKLLKDYMAKLGAASVVHVEGDLSPMTGGQ